MKIYWTEEAARDRDAIWNYIAANNPEAALRIDALFTDAAAMLTDFPFAGPLGKVTGTRELIPHESYRLVYELYNQTVWILAIVHTARQWPPPTP
ncbi:MAG TPA: type II toxin-antitoxin system RelE/ParE family toxin [Alphaproteobacteria bacterium]|nr:type II toxin-antitoxin system RelE/ParE family toxin [Alphaproteobacteria bacterium]